jgi:hypothetical protein
MRIKAEVPKKADGDNYEDNKKRPRVAPTFPEVH